MLSDENQRQIVSSAQWTCEVELRCVQNLYSERDRPFHHMRPKLFLDGDRWCALYGENLQDGLCGFGKSASEAASDFDVAFYKKLPVRERFGGGEDYGRSSENF